MARIAVFLAANENMVPLLNFNVQDADKATVFNVADRVMERARAKLCLGDELQSPSASRTQPFVP